MSRSATDETMRFMQAIAELSAAPDDIGVLGRWVRPPADHDEPVLGAMLAEISQTVLRRILVFRISENNTLKLDVMERRVVRVLDSANTISDAFVRDDQNLTPADAAQLLEAMRQFSQRADQIFVVSEHVPAGQNAVFDGIAVADLNALLDEKVASDGVPPSLVDALEAAQSHAIAMVCGSETDEVWRWGDEASCQSLAGTGVARAPDGDAPNSLAIWGQGQGGPEAILLAQWQGFRILIHLPNTALDAQFRHWHELLFKAL